MSTVKRALALILSLVLFLGAARADEEAPTIPSGGLRVYLSSLGAPEQFDLTLQGEYVIGGGGFAFDEGAALSLRADEGRVWMTCGALRVNFGERVTFERRSGGLYIAQSKKGNLYPGSLAVTARGGWLQAVLTIDVETYLVGVLPYEMNDAFPLEALKAQAVAARTYALWRAGSRIGAEYDLVDTAADQVFYGYNEEYTNAIAAVEATKGEVGLYRGAPVPTYYTASNGGYTALPGEILGSAKYDAYLAVEYDEADLENPLSLSKSVTVARDFQDAPEAVTEALIAASSGRLEALGFSPNEADIRLRALEGAEAVEPLSDPADGRYGYVRISYTVSARRMEDVYAPYTAREKVYHAVTGRDVARTVVGKAPGAWEDIDETFTCDIPVYDTFKRALGLSLNENRDCETVAVAMDEAGATVTLRRYGHGVGLSQRGAQRRAGSWGETYDRILAFYYPGLSFERLALTADGEDEEALCEVSLAPAAVLTAGEGEYLATVVTSSRTGKLNVRQTPSMEGKIVAEVYNGMRLVVTGGEETNDDGAWLPVRTQEGVTGWCARDYLVK